MANSPAPGTPGSRSFRPAKYTALVVSFLLLAASACTSGSPPVRGGGEIRIEASEPGSLDPARSDDADEIMIVRNIFKGLVDYDPVTGAVRPASAIRWKVTADARQFTFTLRRNNSFSNGEAVTADSFVRAFNRAASKASASPLASKLSNIVGYKDYRDAKTDNLDGVRALDESRLEITLSTSDADFVSKLGQPVFAPLPSEAAISTQKPSFGEHPIGNGPFMVDEWKHNEAVRLEPNPRYYGTKPKLSLVTFVLLSDLDLAYEQWQAGNLDWTRVPPKKERQAEAQNQGRTIKKSPSTLMYLVAITNLSPTHNLLLRQALSLAIDRRAISTRLSAGLNPPASGVFPPGMPGHRDAGSAGGPCFFCLYDPGKALDLLDTGRVPRSLTVTLAYPTGLGMDEWVSEAAASIERAVHLTTRLVPKRPLSDYRAFLKGTNSGLLGGLSITMGYPSPENFLQPLLGPGGDANYSRWSNASFDQYMADARVARDDQDRLALYRRAEDLVVQNLPIIPLWWRGELRLVNLSRFTKLDMDPFGYPTLETAAPKTE